MISYIPSKKEIVIENENNVTINKIYDSLKQNNIITRSENSYVINANIRLKNSSIVEKNVSIIILGEFFQIEKDSFFKLGVIDDNGRTYDGGYLSMPNVNIRYGFGEDTLTNDATNSGDVFLYNSKIDIWGFWGFFRGPDQHVEIIDCIIHGFGRVEGTKSIVRNVTFDKSHSRYGVLSLKGVLKEYSNLSSYASSDCSYYFNPMLADDLRLTGGTFIGYSRLVYCEPSQLSVKTIRFVDSDIRGNRQIKDSKNTIVEIAYSFKPIFMDNEGQVKAGENVTITDSTNEEVWTGVTDDDGKISAELVIFCKSWEKTIPYENDFFKVTVGDNDYLYEANDPFVDQPFYVVDGTIGDGNSGGGVVIPSNPTGDDNSDTVIPDLGEDDPSENTVELDPNARAVMYVCTSNVEDNITQKNYVRGKLPDELKSKIPVFVDTARDAYNVRLAWENMLLKCISGKIKTIYVYEVETFGPTRRSITSKILSKIGVEIIPVREAL